MEITKPKEYSKFFDETLKEYPWIFELGDGHYTGIQGGYVITIGNKQYKTPIGYRGMGIQVSYEINGDTIKRV